VNATFWGAIFKELRFFLDEPASLTTGPAFRGLVLWTFWQAKNRYNLA